MPLLDTITGSENNSDASAQIFIFHVPQAGQRGMEESHIGRVAKDPALARIVSKVGFPVYRDGRAGVKQEIGGKWTEQKYDVGEGQIFKIFASRKLGFQGLQTNTSTYIRIRENGPFTSIVFTLLDKRDSGIKTAEIKGRFDVLTLADVKALGVATNPNYDYQANPVYRDNFIAIRTLDQQKAAPVIVEAKVVVTPEGEERRFSRSRTPRGINI